MKKAERILLGFVPCLCLLNIFSTKLSVHLSSLFCAAITLFDMPINWQIGFQNPATPIMEGIIWLHNYIMLFLIIVVVVVFWFLGRSLYLFNENFNISAPMEFNHDPVIETIWTVAPAFVLIAIAIPSFSLLYSMDELISPTLTVKIIGHQWYWSYEIDTITRKDLLYDYVKRDYMPELDLFDLQRWEGEKVTAYYLNREANWRKACGRLFVQKVIDKVMWTNKGISMGHMSFLTQAVKLFWPEANYRSVVLLSPTEKVKYIDNIRNQIRFKPTFYSLLWPTTHTRGYIALIQWIGPSVRFDSYMVNDSDLKLGGLRLLEVDNRLVLPVKRHIRLLVTSADVIHSWAVPSFGVKVDAIPGRLNQAALYIKREGFFYGQCSELCGVNHAFMPINVQVVNYNKFIHWIRLNSNPTRLEDLVNSSFYIKDNSETKKQFFWRMWQFIDYHWNPQNESQRWRP